MKSRFLILVLLLCTSFITIVDAQEQEQKTEAIQIIPGRSYHIQIIPGRSYQASSFSELFANPQSWNGKYITIYGYYDKTTNLLKESEIAESGLTIIISPTCKCELSTGWMRINGLFTFDGGYKLEAEHVSVGKDIGYKCTLNDECQSNFCLLCPGRKMILPGFISYEDLPTNANFYNLSVWTGWESYQVKVWVIPSAPEYGYCGSASIFRPGDWDSDTVKLTHDSPP
jgi:hypothetical protein